MQNPKADLLTQQELISTLEAQGLPVEDVEAFFAQAEAVQTALLAKLAPKLKRLDAAEKSLEAFLEKTEWVQREQWAGELGMHLADAAKLRCDIMKRALEQCHNWATSHGDQKQLLRLIAEEAEIIHLRPSKPIIRSSRTGSIICACRRGYGSEIDGRCSACRERLKRGR